MFDTSLMEPVDEMGTIRQIRSLGNEELETSFNAQKRVEKVELDVWERYW